MLASPATTSRTCAGVPTAVRRSSRRTRRRTRNERGGRGGAPARDRFRGHGGEADMTELDALVYDWNRDGRAARADYRPVQLDDETLRDGLQGPSVRNPPLEVKKRLLHLMDELGIDTADIGLPGASERALR